MIRFAADLKLAARSLCQSRGFSLAVLLTLALGIGASAAVFAVFETVLLSPLPYREPERLAMIWSRWVDFPDGTWVSDAEVAAYRRDVGGFAGLATFVPTAASLTGTEAGAAPERAVAALVSPDLLDLLGVRPLLGRNFLPAEGRDVGTGGSAGAAVAILGEDLWRRRYGADPALVGRTIELDRVPYTVVGIAPASFRLPIDFGEDAPTTVLVPYATDPAAADSFPKGGGAHGLYAVARLAPGVSVEAARAELGAVVGRLTLQGHYPPEMRFEAALVPLPEEVAGAARPALAALLGAVGFVLLTAAANVASLLLARREARGRELAIRAAMGASRGDLVRHLLAEALLLAAAGGALGLWLADLALSLLAVVGPVGIPRVSEVGVDGRVAAFALAAALLSGLAASLAPVLQTRAGDLGAALKDGGRGGGAGAPRERLRRGLVAAQVALAVVLTAGAGLMVQSLVRLLAIDAGFRAEGVLTFRLSPPDADYPGAAQVDGFYRELLARLDRLPGVEAAGAARRLPLAGEMSDWELEVEGYAAPAGTPATGDWQVVTPGYVDALGIRLLAGRTLEEADDADGPYSILVSESMARAYWPDGKALGRRVRLAAYEKAPWMTVVGVVADVKHTGLTAEARRTWYWPLAQTEATTTGDFFPRTLSVAVRTRRDAAALAPEVRAVLRDVDPRLPAADLRTMEEILGTSVARPRFTMALFLAFGALALALAAIGVYGVVAYSVARRTREIGIRMAVGARPGDVMGMVVGRAALLAGIGLAAGIATTLALGGLLAGIVYGVDPADPATLAAVVALLAATALAAAWLPARRAAAVDPMNAIRQE